MRRRDLDVDLRRLRRSAALAGVGDGVIAVALPLLTASLTRDPLDVASVVAAQYAAWVLVALVGHRFGTRIDRRTTIGLGDTIRAVAIGYLGMKVLIGEQSLQQLQLVAFAVGLGEVLTDDAERTATTDLAGGPKESSPGTRTAATGMATLALIGLPLGGFLYEVLAAIPPLVDVLPFAVAALFALSLRRRVVPAVAPGGTSRPKLLAGTGPAVLVAAAVSALSGAALGVLVLFALDDLGLGAPAFGAMLAGLALAVAVGGLVAPEAGRVLGLRPALTLALLVSGGGLAGASVLADPESPYPAVLALGVAAGSAAIAGIVLRALMQTRAGRPVTGPALDAVHVAVWAAVPIGALAGGAVAVETGVSDLLLYLGAATGAVGLLAAALRATAPTPSDNRLTPVSAPWSDAKDRQVDRAGGGVTR